MHLFGGTQACFVDVLWSSSCQEVRTKEHGFQLTHVHADPSSAWKRGQGLHCSQASQNAIPNSGDGYANSYIDFVFAVFCFVCSVEGLGFWFLFCFETKFLALAVLEGAKIKRWAPLHPDV